MSFSENLINIFNEVAKQVGVVINWSDENVLPYIKDLCDRIVNFEMMVTSLLLALFIIGLIMGIANLIIGVIKRKKYYTTDYRSDSYVGHFILGISSTICSSIFIIVNTITLFKCLTIKEVIIIDFITKYIN